MKQEHQDEIAGLTKANGGEWGINHTLRLLRLIEILGKNMQYDADVVWISAHLHDWGAYPPWLQTGVDHAIRSKEVAKVFLQERSFPEQFIEHVLECIVLHHSGGPHRSLESILLSDADALDFLGVVGVLRDFSKNPKDMRGAFEITRKRRDLLPGSLCLEKSKEIAVERIKYMDDLFSIFQQETWGCF